MNKNFDLDKTGKEMPYRVPDGFFAELEANVAAELKRFPAAGTAADSCGRHRGKRAVFMGTAIAAAVAAAGSMTMSGQDRPDPEKKVTREQLAVIQAGRISEELAFDDATRKKFIYTYCKCQEEIWALGPENRRPEPRTSGAMTDEEVDKAIRARFEHSGKLLEIREKYYEEYSTFLSPKQIQKVYDIERRMMDRLSHHRPGPHPDHDGAPCHERRER